MPFGLLMKICPFELSLPAMTEASRPETRFTAIESWLGRLNLTSAFPPIEKLCQLMFDLVLDWSIFMRPCSGVAIWTWPAVTVGAVGRVFAGSWGVAPSSWKEIMPASNSQRRYWGRIMLFTEQSRRMLKGVG